MKVVIDEEKLMDLLETQWGYEGIREDVQRVLRENSVPYEPDARIERIANHYGMEAQLNVLQEECAELIQAVSKYKRAKTYPDFDGYWPFMKLTEEITDVEIMTEQIKYFLACPNVFAEWRNKKISRQIARIECEEEDNEQDSNN